MRDSQTNLGFVTGVLSQNAWEHTLSGHLGKANEVFLHSRMTPPGIDFRAFAAGEMGEGLPCGVLAVFNWSEEPRVMEVVGEHLGIDESCEMLDMDFFASAAQAPVRRKGRWEIRLEPHSVRLSHLGYANVWRILDSDW